MSFESVSPVLPVGDLDAALDRYRRLGFQVRAFDGPERYGFADRDGVSLHLSESDGHDPLSTAAMVYLYVSDADEVHREWLRAEVGGRLREPWDTGYGLREFSYVDPDGTLHRVGSPLPGRG
ncbi:VOC family protein [Actinoplanes sp. NPDC051861]|uniref:bleomycin resistance protein n=1 Tax=Actinoplanes sp. NPDC051861 TaxID=3155170 RepID=UPI003417A703